MHKEKMRNFVEISGNNYEVESASFIKDGLEKDRLKNIRAFTKTPKHNFLI
jgi:hypothetical protein